MTDEKKQKGVSGVKEVVGALAGAVLQASYEAGNPIEIPSLGLTFQKDQKEEEPKKEEK